MLLDLDNYDITILLHRWNEGDQAARNELFQLVYATLCRTARQALRETPSFSASALVSETFVRLGKREAAQFRDRTHFAAVCVQAMRAVLVDDFRRRQVRAAHAPGPPPSVRAGESLLRTLDVQTAVAELSERRPEEAEALTLRYWAGLDMNAVASVMKCSVSKVQRLLDKAEFFLQTRLSEARG